MSINTDISLTLTLNYQGKSYPMTLQLIRTKADAANKKRSLYFRSTQEHPARPAEKICVQAAIAPAEKEVGDAEALTILKTLLE